jgi:hypothetical protein
MEISSYETELETPRRLGDLKHMDNNTSIVLQWILGNYGLKTGLNWHRIGYSESGGGGSVDERVVRWYR